MFTPPVWFSIHILAQVNMNMWTDDLSSGKEMLLFSRERVEKLH